MTNKQTTIDERITSALNGAAVSSARLTELNPATPGRA